VVTLYRWMEQARKIGTESGKDSGLYRIRPLKELGDLRGIHRKGGSGRSSARRQELVTGRPEKVRQGHPQTPLLLRNFILIQPSGADCFMDEFHAARSLRRLRSQLPAAWLPGSHQGCLQPTLKQQLQLPPRYRNSSAEPHPASRNRSLG
jgi:hypothetical protein